MSPHCAASICERVILWQHAEAGEERNTQKPAAREAAVVLDTALVQALLSTDSLSTALQVLSGPNYADVGACEDVMLEGKNDCPSNY